MGMSWDLRFKIYFRTARAHIRKFWITRQSSVWWPITGEQTLWRFDLVLRNYGDFQFSLICLENAYSSPKTRIFGDLTPQDRFLTIVEWFYSDLCVYFFGIVLYYMCILCVLAAHQWPSGPLLLILNEMKWGVLSIRPQNAHPCTVQRSLSHDVRKCVKRSDLLDVLSKKIYMPK